MAWPAVLSLLPAKKRKDINYMVGSLLLDNIAESINTNSASALLLNELRVS